MNRFDTVAIANRGEIAVRIIRSAHALGLGTVALYSDADVDAPHVALADRAVRLGPPSPADSYLNIEKVLRAATKGGAQAVHPGYGFLAENPVFAKGCADAGLIFVGPSAEAMALMGDKAEAKARMVAAGVPQVPGSEGATNDLEELAAEAAGVGYPLLVKAAAGGGGRGMRAVHRAEQLSEALESAGTEAKAAFGDGRLLLERLVVNARHVEVQVMADAHGAVLHLGERDCSAQRRFQKIVEESPSPAVDADLRRRMGQTAVEAAQAIDYVGAGTVEFLLAPDGDFFFLEMNTRLQVEHPVSEMVTGLDLVALQLRVAQGQPLGFTQEDVTISGHAVEARLYAEDPAEGFLPQSGPLLRFRPAADGGAPWRADPCGVRVDAGVQSGGAVSSHYDPMLAKIIAHAPTRAEAVAKLSRAVAQTKVLGVKDNRLFLLNLLRSSAFATGQVHTGSVEVMLDDLVGSDAEKPSSSLVALAALLLSTAAGSDERAWRSSGQCGWTVTVAVGRGQRVCAVVARPGGAWKVEVDGSAVELSLVQRDEQTVRYQVDGVIRRAHQAIDPADGALHLECEGRSWVFLLVHEGRRKAEAEADGLLRATINGQVLAVRAGEGDAVRAGQRLVVLEAMKMEHGVVAPADGTVARVQVEAGDQVTRGQLMLEITVRQPESEEEAR